MGRSVWNIKLNEPSTSISMGAYFSTKDKGVHRIVQSETCQSIKYYCNCFVLEVSGLSVNFVVDYPFLRAIK